MTQTTTRPTRAAIVDRIVDHTSDTRSLFMSLADGHKLRFAPGQFISIAIALLDETRTRPYTIASPVGEMPFEICFNRVPGGRGAEWLFDRKVGDAIDFTGPYGAFTMESVPPAETIFLAEGTAIAPIRPMIHRAMAAAHPAMALVYAASSQPHLLYRTEFESFAMRDTSFRFEPMVLQPSGIYPRLLAEAERRWVATDTNRSRHFYLCGVGKGVIALRDLLRGAGYERRSVHYEQW